MLHEHIKDLARRSASTDRVIFGESKRRHPLGFEGFNIDLTVDNALLSMNSQMYDIDTEFTLMCESMKNTIGRCIESLDSVKGFNLYKEGKLHAVGESIKKWIKKIWDYIKSIPKRIRDFIKKLFGRKAKSDASIKKAKRRQDEFNASANKTKEAAEAMAENINAAFDEMFKASKAKMDEAIGRLADINADMAETSAAQRVDLNNATDKLKNTKQKLNDGKPFNYDEIDSMMDTLKDEGVIDIDMSDVKDSVMPKRTGKFKFGSTAESKAMANTCIESIDVSMVRELISIDMCKKLYAVAYASESTSAHVVLALVALQAMKEVPYVTTSLRQAMSNINKPIPPEILDESHMTSKDFLTTNLSVTQIGKNIAEIISFYQNNVDKADLDMYSVGLFHDVDPDMYKIYGLLKDLDKAADIAPNSNEFTSLINLISDAKSNSNIGDFWSEQLDNTKIGSIVMNHIEFGKDIARIFEYLEGDRGVLNKVLNTATKEELLGETKSLLESLYNLSTILSKCLSNNTKTIVDLMHAETQYFKDQLFETDIVGDTMVAVAELIAKDKSLSDKFMKKIGVIK